MSWESEPMRCEVCEETVPGTDGSVRAVPGVPISVFFCDACLKAGRSHPWWILVANTAMIGGLEHAAPWWEQLVLEQLPFFEKSLDDFNEAVREEIEEIEIQERSRAEE